MLSIMKPTLSRNLKAGLPYLFCKDFVRLQKHAIYFQIHVRQKKRLPEVLFGTLFFKK